MCNPSDSDDDYQDFVSIQCANTDPLYENRSVNTNPKGQKVRGKDIVWIEYLHFNSLEDFNTSDIWKDIKENFTRMRKTAFLYADTELYVCKYSRKVGYKACNYKFMIRYLTTSDEVVIDVDENYEHVHEREENFEHNTNVFQWTSQQAEIIIQGILNEAKPAVIRRNLTRNNAFINGNEPTALQLSNKIAYLRRTLKSTSQILTTHDLRENIATKLQIPEDENQAYIVYHEVRDEKEYEEPRFVVIWSTRKMLNRVNIDIIQDDATYRLNWHGYPFFVSGVSTSCGQFFPTYVSLSSHEDAQAWKVIYEYLKTEIGITPKYRMGDGAREITKAGIEVRLNLNVYFILYIHSRLLDLFPIFWGFVLI